MKILIKNAKIISSESPFNEKVKDIFIDNGIILEIDDNINKKNDILVEKENLHISIGWFDFGVNVGFPKDDNLENINSIEKSASKGGFTEIGVYSSNLNKISSISEVSYFKDINSAINFYPIASATKEMKGEELNESYRLKEKGAIAFCDNKKEIKNPLLSKIIMEYNTNINSTTVIFPNNENLSYKGIVNESSNSINTGLKTVPKILEIINIGRDLEIAEYTNSKIHFQCISLKESIEKIKIAKKKGVKVTSHITPHHLILNDEEILDFNTNSKVLPPLRNKEDNIYFRESLVNGDIEFISSDHTPVDIENKNCEFDISEFGTIGMESCFGIVNKYLEKYISLEKIISVLSMNPRKVFNLDIPKIGVGERANLTFFNPDKEYIFSENDIKGKQSNSIFLNKKMKGEVYGVLNNNKIIL